MQQLNRTDRILDCESDNAKAYAMSAKTHVRRKLSVASLSEHRKLTF